MKRITIVTILLVNSFFLGSFTTKMSHFTVKQHPLLMQKYPNKKLILFIKIAKQESDSGIYVFNKKENAVGIVQIRPIMVLEANRILGFKKFSLDDRWDDDKSYDMFCVYMDRYNPEYDVYYGARIWNGGAKGYLKASTINYANEVMLN